MKIYIRSLFSFVDQFSKDMLFETLHHLAEEHDELEFWFTSCRTDFDTIAIRMINRLRKQYPNKHIDVVAITDPLVNNYVSVDDYPEEDYRFPIHSVTKIKSAPLIQGKCEQYEDRYLVHFRKIEAWIIGECDIILAFYYEDVPHPLTFEMQRIKRSKIVIPIYNPTIAQALLVQMNQLDERPKRILFALKEGRTYTSIAKEYQISAPRVRQQAYTAIRSLFKEVKKNLR